MFPPTVQERSLSSTPSIAFIVCRLFDDGHSDPCAVISHCGFDLHFSNNEWCWASFHVLLYIKGNYKQGEKTTFRMGENNSKWNNWQRINFQNIQALQYSCLGNPMERGAWWAIVHGVTNSWTQMSDQVHSTHGRAHGRILRVNCPQSERLSCLYGGSLLCLSLASNLAWAHIWPDSGSFLVAHASLNQDGFQREGFWGAWQDIWKKIWSLCFSPNQGGCSCCYFVSKCPQETGCSGSAWCPTISYISLMYL